MKIPTEDSKFLSQWKYYEVARYVSSLDRVIRDKVNNTPLILSADQIEAYSNKNNNVGIYTSVFAYNSEDIEKSTRLGPLYFDIDSSDIELAFNECKRLYDHLVQHLPKTAVLVYFTGKKGFHIECEPIALGINPSNSLAKVYRYIATDLKDKLELSTLDFSVYDLRRMWRYPNSKHQSTGLHKVLLNPKDKINFDYQTIAEIIEYAQTPQSLDVDDQNFDYKANEWYRQYTYDMEESQKRRDNPIEYFNKFGSKAFKEVKNAPKAFDKQSLHRGCSAVVRLENQAKEEHYLEHEARLFLCSILTYTEDSIRYLHEILSNCEDYNFEKSSAHINDWIRRRQMGIGGRPYTCERANSVGVGCGDCALELKNKYVKLGDRLVETQEKSSPSPIRFAYKNIKEQ
jgi:hypothetical protein